MAAQLTSGSANASASESPSSVASRVLSAAEWAAQQYAQVDLGDRRRNRLALEMGAKMAAHPEASLPNQMEEPKALRAAYGLLNNEAVTMEALLAPHCRQTLADAGQHRIVLMAEDTSELDFTAHQAKKGLGPIGDGKGKGLLLHSTLAIEPTHREVLGLAHVQALLREPTPKSKPHWTRSPEGQVWEVSAKTVGRPPEGVLWVHVSDRGSDIFEYMAACLDNDKHFVLRAFHNRVLQWDDEAPEATQQEAHALLDYARSLTARPDVGYTVEVPARKKQPARQARVVLQWTQVTVPAPMSAPAELRRHAPIKVWLLRVWEPNPPEGAEPIEWVLLSSLPIGTLEEAYRTIDWYTCRWLCEDYHQCLKTGCQIEHSQLDDGADISRLLGFAAPIAVRLLQLRQAARQTPELMVTAVVEPLMVEVLALRQRKDARTLTIVEFWRLVSRLGGHQGRRQDGPPGWRTVWKGWRYLSDLTEGARLFAGQHQNISPV